MRLHRPSALLLGATLVLGAVATPSLAFADGTPTTTDLTPAELVSALTAAQTASKQAGATGWSQTLHEAVPEVGITMNVTETYAINEGRGYLDVTGNFLSAKEIDVQHKGSYLSTATFAEFSGAKHVARVLAAIGRPHATWIYAPDKTVDLADPADGIAVDSPDGVLAAFIDPTETAVTGTPTETVSADAGTTTYTFSATLSDSNEVTADAEAGIVTVTLNASGQMTALTMKMSDDQVSGTFKYGVQHIALPTASQVVTLAQFEKGVPLLTMSSDVRKIATTTRTEVARKAHKKSSTAHLIRKDAVALAAKANKKDHEHVFSARIVKHGVRVTATNPFTHAKVSYTIKAVGKRAVLHRG